MSFCQKHQNHHCIHSHNCNNRNHKGCLIKNCQKHNKDIAPTVVTKSHKNLRKISQKNQEQCHFRSTQKNTYAKCKKCEAVAEQMKAIREELNQAKKQNSQSSTKWAKIGQENRHLNGVVQYYRQQMDRIIKCGQKDLSNQIKKHLKENSQLSAKNKVLYLKLGQFQNLIENLQKINDQYSRKLHQARNQKQQVLQKCESLMRMIKKQKDRQNLSNQNTVKQSKKMAQIQQKHLIIVQQLNRNIQILSKQNRRYQAENKDLHQKLQVIKCKLSNDQKLTKMQLQSISEKQNALRMKNSFYQSELKSSKQKIFNLEKDLKIAQQQLSYCKKVIQKQLKLSKQNKQLYEQIKEDIHRQSQSKGVDVQKHEKQPIRPPHELNDFNNKQKTYHDTNASNRNQKQYIFELQKQIKNLRQKILILETNQKGGSHSIQHIQQYILKIGASEAFRKIIQQKNQYIKRLIKQKEVLYQKGIV